MYKQGIPKEPGLYWYRETLESEARLVSVSFWIRSYSDPVGEKVYECHDIREEERVFDLDGGFFIPAIAPEVK